MYDFGRVLTAMVTPFDENLQVDFDRARKLARFLVDHGSDGIVVSGTTGEASTLTPEEKFEMFRVVVDEVGDRAKVIANTGNNDTPDSLLLTKEAEKIGVHGVMAVVPYYNKPPQEGIYQHFKAIADSTNLPIVLYNIPGRTVTSVAVDTLLRLSQIDNIVAIKEATGNLELASEMRRLLPEDFLIYSGEDGVTLPMLAIGAHGVISVASHIIGLEMQNMIKNFEAGNVKEATQIHLNLMGMFRGLFMTTNPILIKGALNLLGHEVGGLRLPMIPANESELQQLRALLISYGKM